MSPSQKIIAPFPSFRSTHSFVTSMVNPKNSHLLAFMALGIRVTLGAVTLESYEDTFSLADSFDPIQAAYWTGE